MGLSSKQVSSDGNGWNQALLVDDARTLEYPKTPPTKTQEQQQQQPEQLKCPRCDSSNTKFCYYNNYNKSQPRHFCKACKRHWTKGGTLRNVPVGGGRKNKRLKMSKTASKTSTTTTTTTTTNNNLTLQSQQIRASLPLGGQFPSSSVVEDKLFSEAFYQNFLKQQQDHSITFNSKGLNDGIYLNSTIKTTSLGLSSQHQQHHDNQEIQQFPYSNNNLLGSFESNPCSISSTITSNHSPILYNFTGDQVTNDQQEEEQEQHQPWNNMHTLSSTRNNNNNNNVMEMMPNNNWGWDDFDKFVSVEADLTIPWDDTDIKP